jgi:hypothetical protein
METTKEQEKLIELSESKNPYSQECHNRQLWSEGFRAGRIHNPISLNMIRHLMEEEYDKNKYDTNSGFLHRFAQVIYDAL